MNNTATRPSKKTKHKNWRNRVYNYLKENEMATSTKLLEEITVGPPPGSPTAAAQLLKRDSRFYSTTVQVLVQRGNYTQPRLIWGIKDEE